MMASTCTTRTATPCETAFSARSFASIPAIFADTAIAVSAFVLLPVCILVVVPVIIVRILTITEQDSKRRRAAQRPED